MSTTTPVPDSLISRLSNRLTQVGPREDSPFAQGSTPWPSPMVLVSPWWDTTLQGVASGWPAIDCLGALGLVRSRVTPLEVILEVQTPMPPDDAETTEPLNRELVRELIAGQQAPKEDDDLWEEDEPLWDPVRSHVYSLVKEYFERADADSETTLY